MHTRLRYGGLTAAAVLTTGLLTTGTATAEQSGTTAPCTISVGSVTSGGDHRMRTFATDGSTVTDKIVARNVFGDGQARMSATVRYGPGEGSELHTTQAVLGPVLYGVSYRTPAGGGKILEKYLTRIGPGWQNYRSYDLSGYGLRDTAWSLRNDGAMERRSIETVEGRQYYHLDGVLGNFPDVKGLALISQTATYDTFLMTHTNGRLSTVRFSAVRGQTLRTDVRPVRMSTWQAFETLVAAPCGQGTVVLGIDRDTGHGYLYSVGHANGLSTVIKGLGKVPGTFDDPVYFRWAKYGDPLLAGD
ncbi:hypothetical protein [Kribbella sp. NPDC004875]|uniref:hypothetical protein n=1 Tax=Kribbella sp. NPDC004875 TaxID=3364107 RepID=UPI0036B3F1FA